MESPDYSAFPQVNFICWGHTLRSARKDAVYLFLGTNRAMDSGLSLVFLDRHFHQSCFVRISYQQIQILGFLETITSCKYSIVKSILLEDKISIFSFNTKQQLLLNHFWVNKFSSFPYENVLFATVRKLQWILEYSLMDYRITESQNG